VYENHGEGRAFRESDRLGGHDPYSNSKACAELLTMSYRDSFFVDGPPIATARAGNVIGGGDWSVDRLIPDLVRGFAAGEPVAIRRPLAIRPWQHVLEPLSGYLALAQALVETPARAPRAVNFWLPLYGSVRAANLDRMADADGARVVQGVDSGLLSPGSCWICDHDGPVSAAASDRLE